MAAKKSTFPAKKSPAPAKQAPASPTPPVQKKTASEEALEKIVLELKGIRNDMQELKRFGPAMRENAVLTGVISKRGATDSAGEPARGVVEFVKKFVDATEK